MSRRHRLIDRRAWAVIRRLALDRDGWRCRMLLPDGTRCGRAGRLEVDHVIPLDRGGPPLDLSNLQSLCRPCHFAKSSTENTRSGPERLAWAAYMRDAI